MYLDLDLSSTKLTSSGTLLKKNQDQDKQRINYYWLNVFSILAYYKHRYIQVQELRLLLTSNSP